MELGNNDPLAQLRDIHLPEAVSQLPTAPGWWALTILFAALAVAIYWLMRRRYRRHAVRRAALTQWRRIDPQRLEAAASSRYLQQLNQLLKQTALAACQTDNKQWHYQRDDIASLSGEAWLKFLDKSGYTDAFTAGCGQLLLTGPYCALQQTVNKDDLTTLHQLALNWIQHARL
jgi:hypothetical protein